MDFETFNDRFRYDPDTGIIAWKRNFYASNGALLRKPGDIAGTTLSNGYVQLRVNGKAYLAHRVAWLLTHKRWPTELIDHINGNPSDNRLCNLREASASQNLFNTHNRAIGEAGFRGVFRSSSGNRWRAVVTKDGKRIYVGSFATPEEASVARERAAAHLQGTFYRP